LQFTAADKYIFCLNEILMLVVSRPNGFQRTNHNGEPFPARNKTPETEKGFEKFLQNSDDATGTKSDQANTSHRGLPLYPALYPAGRFLRFIESN
jgi:hypothetical protein